MLSAISHRYLCQNVILLGKTNMDSNYWGMNEVHAKYEHHGYNISGSNHS